VEVGGLIGAGMAGPLTDRYADRARLSTAALVGLAALLSLGLPGAQGLALDAGLVLLGVCIGIPKVSLPLLARAEVLPLSAVGMSGAVVDMVGEAGATMSGFVIGGALKPHPVCSLCPCAVNGSLAASGLIVLDRPGLGMLGQAAAATHGYHTHDRRLLPLEGAGLASWQLHARRGLLPAAVEAPPVAAVTAALARTRAGVGVDDGWGNVLALFASTAAGGVALLLLFLAVRPTPPAKDGGNVAGRGGY
jgi:hypothetical protein